MNGARLGLSLLLVALPAIALPAVRRSRHPQAWALVIAVSLGAGFVLVEASLIHAALPLVFTTLGMDSLAEACRTLGGHLFGDPLPFSGFAGLMAVAIAVRASRGTALTVRAQSKLRRSAAKGSSTPLDGQRAVFLPLQHRWAAAIPGTTPQIVLASSLKGELDRQELDAVVEHEIAHLEHHHIRFFLVGVAVRSGLWFLPWMERASTALRLALERAADEYASARSGEIRAHIRSAISKLASLAPSALAGYRIKALETRADQRHGREWAWPTAASATIPLALALAATLVVHLLRVTALAGGG